MIQIQVALRAPRQGVEADVQVEGDAPDQPPRFQPLALRATVGKDVEGGGGQDVEVVAADLGELPPPTAEELAVLAELAAGERGAA